ncbi:MAG: hypothetical protein ABIU86_07290 [Gemmatimonadaceae bacterium]
MINEIIHERMPDVWNTRIGLYPKPFKWLFENGLHFLVRVPSRQ